MDPEFVREEDNESINSEDSI